MKTALTFACLLSALCSCQHLPDIDPNQPKPAFVPTHAAARKNADPDQLTLAVMPAKAGADYIWNADCGCYIKTDNPQ